MTEDDNDISPSEIDASTNYKRELNYELLLMKQVNRISIFREINTKQYAGAVDTLGIMLMKDLRKEADKKRTALGLKLWEYNGMNEERAVLYDKLWMFIEDLLEDNNIIYKKSSFGRSKF